MQKTNGETLKRTLSENTAIIIAGIGTGIVLEGLIFNGLHGMRHDMDILRGDVADLRDRTWRMEGALSVWLALHGAKPALLRRVARVPRRTRTRCDGARIITRPNPASTAAPETLEPGPTAK